MKKSLLAAFVLFFTGCKEPQGFVEPEDPLDTGREFIRGILDGDIERASLYISNDLEDKDLFKRYQQYMQKQPRNLKLQLKSSSIIINKIVNENDSTTFINFSNSFTKTPTDLKIIKKENKWRIDFSYTFSSKSFQNNEY